MNGIPSTAKAISRTTPQLYRDCLRLVQHIAGKSKKGQSLRGIIRNEFRKNMQVSDPALIENLKSNAIRGLANYLMIESTAKDKRLQTSANAYAAKSVKDINGKNDDKSS
mmetsp:Transcript_14954/g.16186  ORF Transcript_14954/g.16186 Transcript_14954/m.16186 type:complete len:110 (+) Transcript_14954:33-362(+)